MYTAYTGSKHFRRRGRGGTHYYTSREYTITSSETLELPDYTYKDHLA